MPNPTFRWSAIGPDDVPAWAALTNLLADSDGTEEFYDEEDLAEELDESGVTPEKDLFAVWDDDVMVAFGQIRVASAPDQEGRIRCQLDGGVHPAYRRRGVGTALMDKLERRSAELAEQRHPDRSAFWRVPGNLEGADRRVFLTERGYQIARYFHVMTRPLPGDAADDNAPDIVLRSPTPDDEESVRRAHNAAFADHWGSTPYSPDRWRDYWTARSNRFDESTLALGPGGDVLSYVLAGQWVDRELFINLVGTVPAARGRGLAAATLARTIARAAESGTYDIVELDVDSDSLTGATRLYERAGFHLKHTTATMTRDIEASSGKNPPV